MESMACCWAGNSRSIETIHHHMPRHIAPSDVILQPSGILKNAMQSPFTTLLDVEGPSKQVRIANTRATVPASMSDSNGVPKQHTLKDPKLVETGQENRNMLRKELKKVQKMHKRLSLQLKNIRYVEYMLRPGLTYTQINL